MVQQGCYLLEDVALLVAWLNLVDAHFVLGADYREQVQLFALG